MQQRFNCQPENLRVWFGPHASPCCYEVSPPFKNNLLQSLVSLTIQERDNKLYFDNALYNATLLHTAGLERNHINFSAAACTMCAPGFHSRRNDGALYVGQSSIAWLV
jgi:copper oxidase (laccase) domain-containing protein